MKKNNNLGIDYEMYAFLKEHFFQGSLFAVEVVREQMIKDYESAKKQEALTKDFKNGWLSAYSNMINNLEIMYKNGCLGNYLSDEEQFDRLFKRFQDAFPKNK